MKIAYFDCFSGISGAKVLGALLDIGVDFDTLRSELEKLPLTDYTMAAKEVTRGGLSATKISVKTVDKGLVRTFGNIRQIIEESSLNPSVKKESLAVFQSLAEAKAKINRKNVEAVHFHEVGAIDSVVDIVGTAIGFNLLKVSRVYCSPLPMGIGMVRTDHGMLPLPSPVTLEILSGVPIYTCDIQAELVTPTGAAIARSFSHVFGNMPKMTADQIGYGAGRAELNIPNVLRLITGELTSVGETMLVTHISAQVEKVDQKIMTKIMNELLAEGATDAWTRLITSTDGSEQEELNIVGPVEKEEILIECVFARTTANDVWINRQSRRSRGK